MVAFPVVQGLNRVRFQHPGTTTKQPFDFEALNLESAKL